MQIIQYKSTKTRIVMTIETQVDQQIALKKFRSEYVSYGFSVILVLKYRA